MKKVLIIPVAALILASCSNAPQENESNLDKLKGQKDSLVSLNLSIAQQITELDAQISSLDTSAKHALVTVLPVQQKKFEHYFSVHGVVKANKNVTLFAESAGNITSIAVKDGQKVQSGQVLVELDADVVKSQLSEIETNLALATELFERQKRLWEQKIGSEVDYLNAKNRKESLEQSKATVERQLRMSQIVAPFSGVVDEIFPRKGEYVGPSSPVVRLINLDQTYLESDVSEAYVGRIAAGTPVRIEFPSLDTSMIAKITRAGDYINPNNRTFKLEIKLNDVQGIALKPNLLAIVHIMDYADEDALVLPARTVQQTADGGSFVYVASQGTGIAKVRIQPIEVGRSYLNSTEIVQGLRPDEFIVDEGARSIREGQDVRVVSKQ